MPVLALDTSAGSAVAVTDDAGTTLVTRTLDEPRHHAEQLAPLVVAALAEAGVDRSDLTAVVVGTGPAPFTGLRVGLVTARSLGLALGVPVLGVSSLDGLAAGAARVRGLAAGTALVVATDARRREVYAARYLVGDDRWSVQAGPVVDHPAEALAALAAPEGAVVVGRGAALHGLVAGAGPDADPPAAVALDTATLGAVPLDPDPADLVRIALARRAAGAAEQPTEPLYLRRPDAVPAAGRKRVLA